MLVVLQIAFLEPNSNVKNIGEKFSVWNMWTI